MIFNIIFCLHFKLKNNNLYTNASYSTDLGNRWDIETGGSLTRANNQIGIEDNDIDNVELSAHLKLKLRKKFSNQFKLYMGAEQFFTDFTEDFQNPGGHLPARLHHGGRGHPRRSQRPCSLAQRPQVVLHQDGGSGLWRRPVEPGGQAGGVGQPQLCWGGGGRHPLL